MDSYKVSTVTETPIPSFFDELSHTIRSPRLLFGLFFNLAGALVVLSFSILYRHEKHLRNHLQFIHSLIYVNVRPGLIGFFLVSWMLADLTCTNQLGSDFKRVIHLTEKGCKLTNILITRNLILAFFSVFAGILGVVIGTYLNHYIKRFFFLDLCLSLAPVGIWLGFGNISSVTLIFCQQPLKQRLKSPKRLLRWLLAASLPYVLALIIFPIGAAPLIIVNALKRRALLSTTVFSVFLLLVWASFIWWLGIMISQLIIEKRQATLLRYMRQAQNENDRVR